LAQSSCPTGPARRAFAEEISGSGTVIWQVRLATDPVQEGIALSPVVIGGKAVFAEENAVYTLRRGDGRRLWKRAFAKIGSGPLAAISNQVYGLWQYRGSVILLVGQVGSHSRLYSLNGATGAVNWALSLGKQGELGSQTLTRDGGLAMIRGHATLTVVNLATGRIRWTRTGVNSTGPVAAGGVVIAAVSGKVRGFSSRTGEPLWTRTGMPEQATLLVSAGRVIVTDDTQNVYPPVPLWPVTALSPATGRALWRTGTGTPLFGQSAGRSGVAVVNSGRQLILIDAATGHVRWRVRDADSQLPADTGTDVFFVNGAASDSKLTLVDVRAASGSVRWSVPAPGTSSGPVFGFGGNAVAFEDTANALHPHGLLAAFRLTTGTRAWAVKVPTYVQVPPVAAGAGLLLQPTDPSIACPLDGGASAVGTAVGSASGAGSSG
jgi:outer membrane protein assembly factor BamB